jgi:hypothetical protein
VRSREITAAGDAASSLPSGGASVDFVGVTKKYGTVLRLSICRIRSAPTGSEIRPVRPRAFRYAIDPTVAAISALMIMIPIIAAVHAPSRRPDQVLETNRFGDPTASNFSRAPAILCHRSAAWLRISARTGLPRAGIWPAAWPGISVRTELLRSVEPAIRAGQRLDGRAAACVTADWISAFGSTSLVI